jgi:hypothetical protein
MQCPRCEAEVLPGNVFCHRCRARVVASTAQPDRQPALPRRGRARWRTLLVALLALVVIVSVAVMAVIARQQSRMVANEAAAVTEVRRVLTAEMAYAQSNGGHYDRLDCLAQPTSCIPRYPANGPRLVDDETIRSATRRGYRFVFHAGPAPERREVARESPTSLAAFAYVASPEIPGRTGRRSFCADASRRVCELKAMDERALLEGACPLSCVGLR